MPLKEINAALGAAKAIVQQIAVASNRQRLYDKYHIVLPRLANLMRWTCQNRLPQKKLHVNGCVC